MITWCPAVGAGEEVENNSVSRCATPCRMASTVEDDVAEIPWNCTRKCNEFFRFYSKWSIWRYGNWIWPNVYNSYFYFQSPCEFHTVQIMAYLLRAWWCSSGGNIPTLFRKAWRRLAESWAGKFEPERRRDSPALLETHRNYEVRPSTSFNVQVLGTPIISDNT